MAVPGGNDGAILALDIGSRRIGVARALPEVRIARPLTTLDNPESFIDDIVWLIDEHGVSQLVVGLPRGLDGQETDQTRLVRAFAEELTRHTSVPVQWIDEAVTSAQAEQELAGRGKPYTKGDIDALAATYILEDYLQSRQETRHV